MQEMTMEEIAGVGGGLDSGSGGLAIIGMAMIPGINVGLAAAAFTIGMGVMLGGAYYGGGGGTMPMFHHVTR